MNDAIAVIDDSSDGPELGLAIPHAFVAFLGFRTILLNDGTTIRVTKGWEVYNHSDALLLVPNDEMINKEKFYV